MKPVILFSKIKGAYGSSCNCYHWDDEGCYGGGGCFTCVFSLDDHCTVDIPAVISYYISIGTTFPYTLNIDDHPELLI